MRGRQAMKYATETLQTNQFGTIYIDVESGIGDDAGTWQDDNKPTNLAAINGYQQAITEAGNSVGIYSNKQQLSTVLTATDAATLAALPEWTAGAGTLSEAQAACNQPFIPAGKVALSQYRILQDGSGTSQFDLNYAC